MSSPRVYRERIYEFGKQLFELRTRVSLTQAQLAAQIGVHWRTVQNWETGASYPKAEMLQRLIALCLRSNAFAPGNEWEEAQALWRQVTDDGPHALPHFDPVWFERTLALGGIPSAANALLTSQPSSIDAPAANSRLEPTFRAVVPVITMPEMPRAIIDLGEVIAVPNLVGREHELATLQQWVVEDHCRVITVVGLGGIGKSSLALSFAHEVLTQFDVVLFRSLQNGPPLAEVLDHAIHTVSNQQATPPKEVPDKIALLVELCREHRCLLILDNFETVMEPGAPTGTYRTGYGDYGDLVQALGERNHQSCLFVTSREKPAELGRLEGRDARVRTLQLSGLADNDCRVILEMKDIIASTDDVQALTRLYGGNPLALHLVSEPIRELFGGDVVTFLSTGHAFFDGVHKLMEQQCARTTPMEKDILYWLAIERELVSLETLLANVGKAVSQREVLVALESLRRRGQIERSPDFPTFTLQPVILEFVTEQVVDGMCQEILATQPRLLQSHALIQASAKDYVRHRQERLIATQLLERLLVICRGAEVVQQRLIALLDFWREQPQQEQGYGPGNVVNLLRLLRGELRGLDFSRLTLRQAYFLQVEMQDVDLRDTQVQESTFTDAFDTVTAVTHTSSGDYWAAASRRGEVWIWGLDASPTGLTLRLAWQAHADMVWGLTFSPDGETLATASWDGTVKLWDIVSGDLLWSGRHTNHVNSVAFCPDGSMLASAGNDAMVRLWDLQSGRQLQTLLHPGPTPVVTWSPHRDLLATGDMEGTIRLWKVSTSGPAMCVLTIAAHTNFVDGLAFSPDGATLASASWDGLVKLWDIAPEELPAQGGARLLQTLAGHTDRVNRVVWSPDGRTLASCSRDRTIWLWDLARGSYRTTLHGHGAEVWSMAFMADSRSLISGSEDGTLRVWDVASQQCIRVMHGYASSLYDVDWSPDGTQVVSGGSDGVVTIHAANGERTHRVVRGNSEIVFGVGWSPDGRWLASSEWDHAIRLWDALSGTLLQSLQYADEAGSYFYGVAWNPDGKRLASGTSTRGILVWDVEANKQQWVGRQLPIWSRHVAWSPDGTKLAGGGDDGNVYVWDAVEETLLQRLVGHHSMITSLAWSPNGRRLASASSGLDGGELFVWDAENGERLHLLQGHPGIIYAVAWGQGDTSGDEVLVSGGGNGNLRWWDLSGGQSVRVRKAHQGKVQALRRSPDGSKLASCGDDGAIMIWDLHSGDYLRTVRRDRPYERMDITGLSGISAAQRASLLALGAMERNG